MLHRRHSIRRRSRNCDCRFARQAKGKLIELVNTGRKDQAVAYLDAMNLRNAGKVLAEFKTAEENKLATELLERIRTLGQTSRQPSVPTDSSDANRTADIR